MTRRVALDTSAAVPFLMASHVAHGAVRRHLDGAQTLLTGHSLAETYSVLTRLPGDARLTATDAARLLGVAFGEPAILPDPEVSVGIVDVLSVGGITGGAVYDALVGLAALHAGTSLVTRDRRAAATYAALGVTVETVPDDR